MNPPGTRLSPAVRIDVVKPLRAVNAALLPLLRGFQSEDWARPTIHARRDVKDLTAHLLHGSLRRITSLRDRYQSAMPAIRDIQDLIAFIQQDNSEFMAGMRRMSPGILIDLIERYDPEVVALFEGLEPDGPGLGVAWAGESVSLNWFDLAREYTEKWHHQQQLRDATGRSALYDPALFEPVLETFARGLPFAYRAHEAPEGARLSIRMTDEVSLAWTLRRESGAWTLWAGADASSRSTVTIPADVAWRLWTKGMSASEARTRLQFAGDTADMLPVLEFVAIMA